MRFPMQILCRYILRFLVAFSLLPNASHAGGPHLRSLPPPVTDDKLIFLQAAWRHGDRTPARTFKSDINQVDKWPQGWGQLTTCGMEQHVILGKKLRERYVNELEFISNTYKNAEIYVRSTDFNRTLTSAISNMIGFYGKGRSGIDYPDIDDWPRGYIPVAVHTAEFYNDYIGNPEPVCPRREAIMNLWKYTPEYEAFMKKEQPLFVNLTKLCGEEVTPFNVQTIYDTLFIEDLKLNVNLSHCNAEQPWNLTRNEWVTDELMNTIKEATYKIEAWTNGRQMKPHEGFDFSVELPKVRGGGILWHMINTMQAKVDCMKEHVGGGNVNESMSDLCKWITPLKYYAYSVHDTTLAALFSTWGFDKTNRDEDGYPHYSACITIELWEKPDKNNYIKVYYWYPNETKFEAMTKEIVGCENGCSLEQYSTRSLLYKPLPDPEHHCQDVSSFNAPSAATMVAILPANYLLGAIYSLIGFQLSYILMM